jgi:molybdate/tungstate transport system permease protein
MMKIKVSILKIALLLALVSILFITLPIIHIFIKLSSKNLIATIRDGAVWHSIFVSASSALLATIIGCILGVPCGYLLSRSEFRFKAIIESIINLPVAIPHVAVGIALLSLFNERTIVGKLFAFFHITFTDTVYGIVLAMLFVSISFIISSSLVGFNNVEPELEMVSRTLGASPNYTFWHITFPLALPAIIRGAVLAFARSISEVGALLILAYYPKTAPILMYERFEQYGLNAARPVTAMVILFSVMIFFTLLYFAKKYAKS